MARVLVTGANGFIGRHLVPHLAGLGHIVIESGRRPREGAERFVSVGHIGGDTDWAPALGGADVVVHLAGIAHRSGRGSEDLYHEVNERGTERLVRQSLEAGVKAFIFLSSIFARDAESEPSPYARSKRSAERHVLKLNEEGARGVVLRPPLVYAWDAPANWQRLQSLAASGLPLPFGAAVAERSLAAVENLTDAITTAIPVALGGRGGGIYEVSDAETLTLEQILRHLRQGMGRPPRLFPVHPPVLQLMGKLTGRSEAIGTLLAGRTADPSAFMAAFGWRPPLEATEAIRRSGAKFKARRRGL